MRGDAVRWSFAMSTKRLASEKVIVNAPMSFAGSAQRMMRARTRNPVLRVVLLPVALLLVLLAWWAVAAWYVVAFGVFGVVTLPYRLLRRGARKRKIERLRHRELLDTLQNQQTT